MSVSTWLVGLQFCQIAWNLKRKKKMYETDFLINDLILNGSGCIISAFSF